MQGSEKMMETMTEIGMAYGMKLLGALTILVIGGLVIRVIMKGVKKFVEKYDFDETVERFAVSATSIVLWVFVILAVLAKFGVEIAPIIASLGLVGFAVGFAVQGSLSNFAAGIMLMIMRPFKVGDVVDVAGKVGAVRQIGLLSCIFTSPDNKMIIIPNAKIFGDVITNVTAFDTRRVDFTVGIGYGDDIDKAKQVCLDVVNAHELVMSDPAPMVAVTEMADSSVNFTLRVWSKTSDYWAVYFDCMENLKKSLDEAGIEIPFPQRTVWLNQVQDN